MTRDDQVLDPALLTRESPLILHRVARGIYANLSGVGAAAYPGRWNLPGQEAIYTSTNSSTVQLEMLVHTRRDEMPSNLASMRIAFTARWRFTTGSTAHSARASVLIYRSLREANDPNHGILARLTELSEVLAVAVPSVLDPHWNVVLYPTAPGFHRHVSLLDVEPFQFDPRLFPEISSTEP